MEIGVWGGLQSIGNGCGIQIDRFSAQTEPDESIFDDFHDFAHFVIIFGGLKVVPDSPWAHEKAQWSSEEPSGRMKSPVVECKAQ